MIIDDCRPQRDDDRATPRDHALARIAEARRILTHEIEPAEPERPGA